MSKNSE